MLPDPEPEKCKPIVDARGFVFVDGVKLALLVQNSDGAALQICDKDRRRSAERGTRLVQVSLQELAKLEEKPIEKEIGDE